MSSRTVALFFGLLAVGSDLAMLGSIALAAGNYCVSFAHHRSNERSFPF